MAKVRAKFFVKQIINHHNGDPKAEQAGEVVLGPVYDDDNKEWSKWTPQGEIKMTITNPAALEAFELGRQYYVGFSPA
ncbi:hypothetical protein [Hoeflea sp.]|uniref:hypothetical protein n=1 Tax=Hoeflea sp. TaxID=1940281 RepID=UPI0019AFD4F3|nr:hypothetical protein [Hoeflea sp.]MBC7280055.1 hypothetical protein [Hoeflea sp.]